VLCAATTKVFGVGSLGGATYSPVLLIVPKPVSCPQFNGIGFIIVRFGGGRQISQFTVDVEVPVTFAKNCAWPGGCPGWVLTVTETGEVAVPSGLTVTPTGVEFPPHAANPAARTIAAPIFQNCILTPPFHLERSYARTKSLPPALRIDFRSLNVHIKKSFPP
jgi:hypothetical protein